MATPEELLNPISDAKPSGDNIRYLPIFDKLKEARRGSGDWLTEGADADYGQVIKISEDLLKNKSKDLQVAAWLAEAYLHRQGFTGFKNGLIVIKGLIENFWETVRPELEDGDSGLRLAPLDWLGGTYLDVPVKQVPISKGDHNLLQYQESQSVGTNPADDDYSDEATKQRTRWAQAVEEKRVT